jgi:hypothetical protein
MSVQFHVSTASSSSKPLDTGFESKYFILGYVLSIFVSSAALHMPLSNILLRRCHVSSSVPLVTVAFSAQLLQRRHF